MPLDRRAPCAAALRSRVPDLYLINPQVSLVSSDGRFLVHEMAMFETVTEALAAAEEEAGRAPTVTARFEGIFTYADPVRRFHTIDFVYSSDGPGGSVFREPDALQRWALGARVTSGDRLHEHPDLGPRMYEQPFYRLVRPTIGRDWLMAIGAATVVTDEKGRVLLQRRRDTGQWEHPGGCLEPGEQIREAAVREVEEETGYRVGGAELAGVLTGQECVVTYPNGDQLRYLDFEFTAHVVGGEMRRVGEETIDVGWFDPADLPPETSDSSRTHIALFLGARGRFLID